MEAMRQGEDFLFGAEVTNPASMRTWNPDSPDCGNPHFAISGESGSGKTWLLRQMIKYLAERGKHVYVLDLHGDLKVEGVPENYIEFKARNSSHGVNPFEFCTDVDNGGVMVQVGTIVTMIKKAFLPSMGVKQESVLRQLIVDSYSLKGIYDDDIDTWERELPSMETLLELIDQLVEYHGQNSASITVLLQKMNTSRRKIAELDYAGYFKSALAEAGISDAMIERASQDEPFPSDDQLAAIEEAMSDVESGYGEAHSKKMITTYRGIQKIFDEVTFLLKRYKSYCEFGVYTEMFGISLPEAIDPKEYEAKDILKTLETMRIYISSISSSGIFTDVKPPVKPGLNRLDISGLPEDLQSFFVDTFASKIFRAIKRRGEYEKQSDKSRGARTDIFLVIDEGVSILPYGKEKDDHKQILNKFMHQSRKYGAALGFASQTPSHYSTAILSAYTKVAMKMQENEKKKAMTLLGVKDQHLFKMIERQRTALVGTGSDFRVIALPGYERPGTPGTRKPVGMQAPATATKKREFSLNVS